MYIYIYCAMKQKINHDGIHITYHRCTLVGAVGYYFYAKSNTIDVKENVRKAIMAQN